MATKDWKENAGTFGTGFEISWDKIGKEQTLAIIEPPDKGMSWAVVIVGEEDNPLKMAKTRSQAISFAKQYMRTH